MQYMRIASGKLLSKYEWEGGYDISERTQKEREKALEKGLVEEVVGFKSGVIRKVERKR